jgi:hypothetical protein
MGATSGSPSARVRIDAANVALLEGVGSQR